jgi:hypothetical protein
MQAIITASIGGRRARQGVRDDRAARLDRDRCDPSCTARRAGAAAGRRAVVMHPD